MTPISQNELIIQNAAARVGVTAVIIGVHNARELKGNDMNVIKHPEITVRLSEGDGNAFAVLAAVIKALKNADVSREEIEGFRREATGGNYDHMLQTCMTWVNVE